MIFTGRIYDHKKIREQHPKAMLVSIQRRPWKYTSTNIPRYTDLGPPMDLFDKTKVVLDLYKKKVLGVISLQRFQEYYTSEYINHLRTDGGAKKRINQIIQSALTGQDVVLLCTEKPGEFCHRNILKDFFSEIIDPELIGSELMIAEVVSR